MKYSLLRNKITKKLVYQQIFSVSLFWQEAIIHFLIVYAIGGKLFFFTQLKYTVFSSLQNKMHEADNGPCKCRSLKSAYLKQNVSNHVILKVYIQKKRWKIGSCGQKI